MKDDIDQAFDEFIEFPDGSDKLHVTTVSTKFFAEYWVEKQIKRRSLKAFRECALEHSDNKVVIDALNHMIEVINE